MRITGLERFLTVIGYLPIVPWFLLLFKAKRDSMFVQFHVRQSAVLSLLWVAVVLVCFLLLVFVNAYAGQMVLFTIMLIATALFLVFMVAGMIKSAIGERYRMPGVADVALLMRL